MSETPTGRKAPRPWWLPRFLGAVPDLEASEFRLLGFVSFALFFENYDFSLLTASLPYIAESLRLEESELGGFVGLIRLGALPSFFVVPFADRLGRRRVFLASVAALSVGTLLTGFAQTPDQFVIAQLFTRTFMMTAATIAFVMVSEELPAAHRGWGIGMLGALASMGHGFSAILFAAVEVLPFGWRALYAIGFLPVLLLPSFRRGVPETRRFEAQSSDAGSVLAGYFEPFRLLLRRFPARAFGIAALGLLTAASMSSVYQFTAQFLIAHRGWEPEQYSMLVLTAGGLGVLGNILAGRLGDRVGRRVVGILFVCLFPLATLGFFQLEGLLGVVSWSFLVLCLTASTTILRAFATELFPTVYRGTSTGLQAMTETVGAATGLALVSVGMDQGYGLASVLSAVSFLSPVGAVVILLFPETRGRELESISEDEAPA